LTRSGGVLEILGWDRFYITNNCNNFLQHREEMGSVQEDRPKAMNFSHHLNAQSKARHPSPLKDIIKFKGYAGMVSLAGGKVGYPK
jgi:hypothetical protein